LPTRAASRLCSCELCVFGSVCKGASQAKVVQKVLSGLALPMRWRAWLERCERASAGVGAKAKIHSGS